MVMEFPDRAAVNEYLKNEPYVSEGVWERIEVEIMNVVLVNGEEVRGYVSGGETYGNNGSYFYSKKYPKNEV